MPFDLSSAQPVDDSGGGFDLSSAQPVGDEKKAPAAPKQPSGPMDYLKAVGGVMGALQAPFQSIPKAISSEVAGPASDVAGLAAIPAHAMGAIKTDPTQVKQNVQREMSPPPMTNLGNYSPTAFIGRGIESLANKAQSAIAPQNASPLRAALGYGAKGAIEQAPTLAGAALGARSAATLPERQAALDVQKNINTPRDDLARAAEAAGYKRPPEHGVKAAVSGSVGKTKTEKVLSLDNEKNAAARLGQEVGIPPDEPPTAEARDAAKQIQYAQYDALANAAGPELQVTNDFRDALVGTLRKVDEDIDVNPDLSSSRSILRGFVKRVSPESSAKGEVPGKVAPSNIFGTIEKSSVEQPGLPISRTIEQASSESPGPHAYGDKELTAPPFTSVPSTKTPTLSTDWAMRQISQLRKYAKADAANRKWGAYDTRMGIANQLENLIENNLSGKNQSLVGRFRQARTQLAKLHLLDRVADDETGTVNLQKLAQLSETPAYRGVLNGEFKLAADFARTYKKATQRLTGEAIPRFTVLDGLFAAGGATSAMFGHPGGLGVAAAEIGSRLAIPALARRGILQNKIPSYQAGRGMQTIAPLLGQAMSGNQIPPPPQ